MKTKAHGERRISLGKVLSYLNHRYNCLPKTQSLSGSWALQAMKQDYEKHFHKKILMPRNQITKGEMKVRVEKLKNELYRTPYHGGDWENNLAHKYLNQVLDIIEEYRD